jgi:uncharacterized protein YecT (DUF1311 family)
MGNGVFRNRLMLASMVIAGAIAMPRPAIAEMYDAEYRSCSEGATAAIVQCLTARTHAWDIRLNAGFKAALQRADQGQREPLRQAQRLWIQYRDANCRFYGMREGSLRQVEAAECLRSMTAERAQELEGMGAS